MAVSLASDSHFGDRHTLNIHKRPFASVAATQTPPRGRRAGKSVGDYAELDQEGPRLVLCHYPFRSWNGRHRGAINLHGHSHGKLKPMPRQFDVGVDAWDWRPIALRQPSALDAASNRVSSLTRQEEANMKRVAAAMMAMLAGCATAGADPAPDRIGRIYTYVRSDRDGSLPETIRVYRAERDRVEVSKMRGRCTNAAYVTAVLDLDAGYATRLGGGRLLPNAGREEFAVLTYDPEARRLDGRIETPDGPLVLTRAVPDQPWHIYDFDLASLTITAQYRPQPRRDFSFGVPLVWPDGGREGLLRYLGRADLRFAGEEMHEGRRALRFEAGGPAFGTRGGPIWFDAAEGHILEASWGIPNHSEHRDFRLRLTQVSDGGADEWRRLLSAHWENCPPAE